MNGERARVLNHADEKPKQVKQLLNQCRAEFTSKITELSKMYVYISLSCYNEYYGSVSLICKVSQLYKPILSHDLQRESLPQQSCFPPR